MGASARIVSARREHYADFARLMPELGTHDPVPDEELWWSAMAPDTLVVEEQGEVQGYAWMQVPASSGYVRHVVVARLRRGQGIGRGLMLALADRLRACGRERWELNVLHSNAPAIALYRSLGMRLDHRTWVVRVQAGLLDRLAAPPLDTRVRDVQSREDALFEQAFELTPGLLHVLRQKPGVRILGFEHGGDPVGVASFDPSYPGCFPFRLLAPRFLRAVLEPLMAASPADAPYVQLVVERDRATVEHLLAHGAALRFEIEHMAGRLPALARSIEASREPPR